MARPRDIGAVSAGEMVQAVMTMIGDGERPEALTVYESDGKKFLDARQRRIAERYLTQFDPVKLEKCIQEQLEKYAPGKTLMEFVIEKRFEAMFAERGDSAKQQALGLLEKMAVILAACHPDVTNRLNCRKVSSNSGVESGSPFGAEVRKLKVKAG